MTLKKHLAISGTNSFGGTFTGTLCGYENATDNDLGGPEYSTEDRAAVTCKICQKIIADETDWRHRKYLGAAQ